MQYVYPYLIREGINATEISIFYTKEIKGQIQL